MRPLHNVGVHRQFDRCDHWYDGFAYPFFEYAINNPHTRVSDCGVQDFGDAYRSVSITVGVGFVFMWRIIL